MEATVHQPGEGEPIGGPTNVTIKATGEETGDSFYLGEGIVEQAFRAPSTDPRAPSRHVLRPGPRPDHASRPPDDRTSGGQLRVRVPGIVHTFSNPSDSPVRFLNFNTPAGWENYVRDLGAALAKGTPSQEEIGQVASRYDFRVA
jgi:hypothetical protein